MTMLLALNLLFYSLSKFGGLGTFEQLEQGHEIEKLHVMAAWIEISQEIYFHRHSVS